MTRFRNATPLCTPSADRPGLCCFRAGDIGTDGSTCGVSDAAASACHLYAPCGTLLQLDRLMRRMHRLGLNRLLAGLQGS